MRKRKYQYGGPAPIDNTLLKQIPLQALDLSKLQPLNILPNQVLSPVSTPMNPIQYSTASMERTGNSSNKSKSKDRFREKRYGGNLSYQSGGNIKDLLAADKAGQVYVPPENLQTLGNIQFDSNKSRKGPNGQMIVQDIKTKKDFGVTRNEDGSYKFWDPNEKVDFYDTINYKAWGLPERSQVPEFTDAFNMSKEAGDKEFYWKGKRYAVKDVDPSIRNAVEVARQQIIDNLERKKGSLQYTPTFSDTVSAVYNNNVPTDEYMRYMTTPADPITGARRGKELGPKAQANLDSLISARKLKGERYYDDKISRVKSIVPIVTSQKGNEESEGYLDKKSKLFVSGTDSLDAVGTARHEFEHVAQDWEDYEPIDKDSPKILKSANSGSGFRGYGQEAYDYLSSPSEIGARIMNLTTLMKEKNLKDINAVRNWSSANRKARPNASFSAQMKGYDSSDPNFDIHQLIDLYSGDLKLLEKHVADYQKGIIPKYQTGGDLVSTLGYRNDSPFKNASQLTINSPNISMENVSTPLLGISNQTGETKLMKPNKKYNFKNTSSVTEMPAYKKGGKINCETGGVLDGILGAIQGIGPALGPIGMAASGVATITPLVAKLFSGSDKTVVSASPGNYASGGNININPKNKGKFTASAKRADMGVQEFAAHVLANKEDYSATQVKRANFARNAAEWNHQMGGDIPLSSDAFQVKGNPNVVDGNAYPHLNANLDHDEVVTTTQQGQKFVFSTDLKDPITGKAFSELASKQERAKGKAEKILKQHPFDEQAKSTISLSNANLNNISNIQEAVATALGYRENRPAGYQTGGTLNDLINPTLGFSEQDRLDALARQRARALAAQKPPLGSNRGLIPTTPSSPKSGIKKSRPTTSATPGKYDWLEAGQNFVINNPDPYAEQAAANEAAGGLPTMAEPRWTEQQRLNVVDPTFAMSANERAAEEPITTGLDAEGNKTLTPTPDTLYKTPWTVGDAFKGLELIGKGIGAFGKAEKEPQLLDNTQITQEVYDPTQALYGNQRNYSNYLAGIGAAAPINLRRGLAGQALASKYSSDAGIKSQYQQMNQGARTQYQERVGNQRRFNVASMARTNEINAANRAAQDSVQQNFFTSLGQFGEDLNRKRYSADMINLFKNQAPDVFDSYIKNLMRNGRQ